MASEEDRAAGCRDEMCHTLRRCQAAPFPCTAANPAPVASDIAEIERLRAEVAIRGRALSDALVTFNMPDPAHRTKWWNTYTDVADRCIKEQELPDHDD